MDKDLLKEGIEQTGKVVEDVYKDALQPTVQSIGKIISYPTRILRMAFSPVEKWLLNSEASLNLAVESVSEKLKKVPEDKIVPLEPYIAVPAILQLSYCENSEDLRNLYANLLASSMNVDKKWTVHPAYVDIIKQLNPDEAKWLSSLPIIPGYIKILHPLIDVVLRIGESTGTHPVVANFTDTAIDKLETPTLICNYIDNLYRLGIITIPPGIHLVDSKQYDSLKNNQILNSLLPIIDNSATPKTRFEFIFKEKVFQLTEFGATFVQTCCKPV